MSLRDVVYVLTALAAVVVAATRLRLRRGRTLAERTGRSDIARLPVAVHTGCGVLAIATWLVFLIGDGHLDETVVSWVGLVALVLWWLVALAGLLVLVRWLPNRGKHVSAGDRTPSWAVGPGLSLLGHLGMVAGVVVFTYGYVML